MKKSFIFIFIFCLFFNFCGCKKSNTETTSAINQKIASEICQIKNYKELSPETIKALAVIFRTNIKNGDSPSALEYSLIDENILSLTRETDGEIIEEIDEIIFLNTNNEWFQEISKTKILEVFALKNEHISSLSNAQLKKDDTNRTTKLIISEKEIDEKELKDNLLLKSNRIDSVQVTSSSLIFHGKGLGFGENFDINLAENLSKKGDSYEGIIKYFKNSYKSIK